MIYLNKLSKIFLSVSIGMTFMMGFISNAHADSYPEISFNTGRGTTVQLTSKELVAPEGILQVCNEGGPVNYTGPCNAGENCLDVISSGEPDTIELDASCRHAANVFADWGANLNFNVLSQGVVVGKCTVGAFWNDTPSGNGSITFTGTQPMNVFQPTQCTNGYSTKTVLAAGELGAMGLEIILSSEFNIDQYGWFDVYACTYHQGEQTNYCSTHFALLDSSITIDGNMQPGGGLRAGDTICLAEDTGRQLYSNYYFTLTEDAAGFQTDGAPLESYGTVFNPDYYIYPPYQNAISPEEQNGDPGNPTTTPCPGLPGKVTQWVE